MLALISAPYIWYRLRSTSFALFSHAWRQGQCKAWLLFIIAHFWTRFYLCTSCFASLQSVHPAYVSLCILVRSGRYAYISFSVFKNTWNNPFPPGANLFIVSSDACWRAACHHSAPARRLAQRLRLESLIVFVIHIISTHDCTLSTHTVWQFITSQTAK